MVSSDLSVDKILGVNAFLETIQYFSFNPQPKHMLPLQILNLI